MSQEVQTVNNQVTVVTDEQIGKYLESMGNDLNPVHRTQFIELAKAFNLNPFTREIYGVKYGDNFNIIVGYEVYIKRAERSGQLNGWYAWTEGNCEIKSKTIKRRNKKTGEYFDVTVNYPVGDMVAKIEIYRKDWDKPYKHKVHLSEYAQENEMWASKPRTMLEKVVIAQGFRRAFSVELGGMPYTKEELPPPSEPIDVTPQNEQPKQKPATHPTANKIFSKLKSEGMNTKQMQQFAAYAKLISSDADSCARVFNNFAEILEQYKESKVIDHEAI
ncbi:MULTISPECIES: phage recombination protein Bet [Cysteiniphilum]|uniref:Phage recombination protein Bet n=1 Tax=Cysteiniphilum litorale TaxID=2056700 RepID=A0A8J2Z5Q0_9GAMM|nr:MULTISPECIES: phage recombination protein Bet [Cysteiniphilum]GGG03157.1 hypothetical protein GCM10010995_20750 [Cysteiniphilum litorale]